MVICPVGRATENRGHRRVARAKAPLIARVCAGLGSQDPEKEGTVGSSADDCLLAEPCRVKGFEKIWKQIFVGFETWSSRDVLPAGGQARPGQAMSQSPAEPSARTACESAAGRFRLPSGGYEWNKKKKSAADGNTAQERGKLKSSHRHPGRRLSSGSTVGWGQLLWSCPDDSQRGCEETKVAGSTVKRRRLENEDPGGLWA
ncbi:predicted protein [Verticillium alfalfae VaMs.102]|uniref:Predicted protein n=1 Tax=Verticillium alfalfae (strain VaMs.102 / ATCC MYA-4576 / FGSC 10136) TaxID=526221 RepID=C9STD0_VERA1|nr:predicted protein [Verticillium alfalfae VaMs.102]EEY22045.1 predicted protein [Verticillium alfalfae VaMs.102]